MRASTFTLLAALLGACGTGSPAAPSAGTSTKSLSPHWASAATKPASAHHFGHNAVWSRGGLGLWNDAAGAPNADVLALVKDLHVGALRFPGGTRAMRYRFEEAIGPVAQ